MIALALVCWVVITLLAAEASWRLTQRYLSARAAAAAVLPATIVWRLAEVVALLITGNPVGSGALMKLDPAQADSPAAPRPPVLGPMLVALLPPVCATIALLAAMRLLLPAVDAVMLDLPLDPPRSLSGLFLRVELIAQGVGQLAASLELARYRDVRTWLGLYLLVCFGLRIVPPRGLLRAAVLSLLGLGLFGLVVGLLWPESERLVRALRPAVTLVAGWELLLLSLIASVSGLIELGRLLTASGRATER